MNDQEPKSNTNIPYLRVIRLLFVIIATFLTNMLAIKTNQNILANDLLTYTFCGFMISVILVFIESQIQHAFPQQLMVGLFGLICGLSTAALIQTALPEQLDTTTRDVTRLSLHLFLGYFGITIGLRYAHRFDFSATKIFTKSEERLYGSIILDTSVLIDGRIVEIIETGFLSGVIVIPNFVINELQTLSDSSDHLKRSKGRRGLDISKRLQRVSRCEVVLLEDDYPNIKGVDKKLLQLAKKYEATLITMDYNLNKVAELEEVPVMNINLLSQALRTVVLPGEDLSLQIIREGKEPNQGIGYLDDGTMVVVENGKSQIGKTATVTVASILQTSAGRMIFARPQANALIREESDSERSISYKQERQHG